MVLDSLQDSAARLMGVGAVGEAAVLGEVEDFLEVAGQFLALHVEGAKALNARSVDEIATPSPGEVNHLREGGGVLARLMGLADVGCAQVDAWHETINKGGLAHTAIATEQRYLATEQGAQLFDAGTCFC